MQSYTPHAPLPHITTSSPLWLCCALKHPIAGHPGEVSVKRAELGKLCGWGDGGGSGEVLECQCDGLMAPRCLGSHCTTHPLSCMVAAVWGVHSSPPPHGVKVGVCDWRGANTPVKYKYTNCFRGRNNVSGEVKPLLLSKASETLLVYDSVWVSMFTSPVLKCKLPDLPNKRETIYGEHVMSMTR